MIAKITNEQWWYIAALIAVYILASVRVAMHAGKIGRNPFFWFFISILFTAIPAMILFNYEYFRPRLSAGQSKKNTASSFADRCPHCGHIIQAGLIEKTGGVRLCPHCRLPLQEGPIV